MVTSIGYSLGAGAGIDTKTLIDDLAKAEKAPREALIARRESSNAAKISALAQASNAIDTFAAALSSLIAGGSLFTQPSVSDPAILSAKAVAGADLSNLSAQLEVTQIAQAQSLVSANLASATAPVGQGTLTLTTASGSHAITIDASNDSLDGLARAINDKKAGVTATVVTDSNGSRLMLKGATGEANAFTLAVPAGTTSGLERFAFGPSVTGGMTAAQSAQDAIVKLDGVEIRRAGNSFADVIPGVQIDLKKAAVGTTVTVGATRPIEGIRQGVTDFVDAYNELHALLAEATAAATGDTAAGPLRGDSGIRQMQRELARLTTTQLSSTGAYKTLSEIGVATNRDGTLRVDTLKLNAALEADPAAVEGLFNPKQYSSHPAVAVVNKAGTVKPGTYTLTNLLAPVGSGDASGSIGGVAMIGTGNVLRVPTSSPAKGLIVSVAADVASVTVTVDSGLGGALQSIRDALRASDGPFAATQERLSKEAKSIATDRETFERRSAAYYERLVTSFTAMDRQVNAFKATQSYLEQQMKIWSNSDD
jgi:flagellar hook-associated protein 2